jgi:hypothetical protein
MLKRNNRHDFNHLGWYFGTKDGFEILVNKVLEYQYAEKAAEKQGGTG